MDKFIASNGCAVWRDKDGELKLEGKAFDFLFREHDVAAREFFLHERDQELGRWRWPENVDYVVYPVGDETVDVLRERSVSDKSRGPGRQAGIARDQAATWDKDYSQNFYAAARAYFAAHPEPKPWHDAKPGEVWVLAVDGLEEMVMVVHESKYGGYRFRLNDREGTVYALDTPAIRAGRRIWPEASND